MFIFQPNLIFIVSQSDPALNVWDIHGNAMTDTADQVADALNWWRQYADIGFGWGNAPLAIGLPEIETLPRADNTALSNLLNPHFRSPMSVFLGKRERQPYGLAWDGNKIFIAYNYFGQEIKTPFAHELGHLIGAQHNTESPNDIMGISPDLSIRPHGSTLQQIRDAGIVTVK